MFDAWYYGKHDDDPDQSEAHVWSMILGAADAVDPLRATEAIGDVDRLAQIIRTVDGSHSRGAGALAEALVAAGVRIGPEPLRAGPGEVDHQMRHFETDLPWPCRYGEAECPALSAGPGEGLAARTDEDVNRLRARLVSICDGGRIDRFSVEVVAEFEEAVAARVRAEAVALIREHSGPKNEAGVCVGVSRWPVELAAAYTAAVDEILEEVLASGSALTTDHDDRVRAEERQRIADRLDLWSEDSLLTVAHFRRIVAAGSAVPVATPEPDDDSQPCPACGRVNAGCGGDAYEDACGPVATPTEPVQRIPGCDQDGHVGPIVPINEAYEECGACHQTGRRYAPPAEQDGQR